MARQKRFKVLKTAIRKYGAPVNIPGTPFFKFDQFDKGNADYHPAQPSRGKVKDRKAKPFAVPTTENPYTIRGSSTRALETSLATTGFTLNDLAVSDIDDADVVQGNPNYVPAKVIIFSGTGATTTVTAIQNKVTGTAYKRKTGNSFTLPFGQGATPGVSLLNAQGYLAAKADATGKGVTFLPERFYGKGR